MSKQPKILVLAR